MNLPILDLGHILFFLRADQSCRYPVTYFDLKNAAHRADLENARRTHSPVLRPILKYYTRSPFGTNHL